MSTKDPIDHNKLNRIIYLGGRLSEQKSEELVAKLFQHECEDPRSDILLFIDSYGGSIDSFITIHDTIKLLNANVATICLGKAMSACLLLLITGESGKRFITPNSRVLMHELQTSSSGKLTELKASINEADRIQEEIVIPLILKYTKIKKETLKDFFIKDTYFNASDALKLGMVDHIITKPEILYNNVTIL